MKKIITIIGILAIILIASIYFINKKSPKNYSNLPQTPKKTISQVRQNIVSDSERKNAPSLEILPTMDSFSIAKNQVWAGVFQLVWDDLANEINKAPIQFAKSQPEMADLLNESSFSVKDLSSSAYYKKLGLSSLQLKQEIENGIWNKFHEKSSILDQLDWSPAPGKYTLYAMLKKDLEYVEKFNKLDPNYFEGSNSDIEYFGDTTDKSSKLKKSVRVLFYNNPSDFAVTLKSKQGDLIHLYRIDGNKTLSEFYTEMKQKSNTKKDFLQTADKFKAPILDFNAQREFTELCGVPIMPSGFVINQAIEAVQFKMDEVGAKLVAEAAALGTLSMPKQRRGRLFYLTGPYAIFIEEPGKQPYFAAYITDPASLNGNK